MKNIEVKGKIVEKSDTMEGYSRYGFHRLSYAKMSDDTGSIKLILWNNQIHEVSVGDTIQIKNGHVSKFKGVSQLNVGKRTGKILVIKE